MCNTERLYKGRSHRKGEKASDVRESGATIRAVATIRDHRDRSNRESDRRDDNARG